MRSSRQGLMPVLFIAVLLGAGLYTGLWYGGRMLIEAEATVDWPPTAGLVESSRIEAVRGRSRSYPYEVSITYTYEVDGVEYRGTRYSVVGDMKAGSVAEAERFLQSFGNGAVTDVFYDPDDPAAAVLAKGGMKDAWLRIAFGGVLVCAGIWVGLRRLRAAG